MGFYLKLLEGNTYQPSQTSKEPPAGPSPLDHIFQAWHHVSGIEHVAIACLDLPQHFGSNTAWRYGSVSYNSSIWIGHIWTLH